LLIELHEESGLVVGGLEIVSHAVVDVAGEALPDLLELLFHLLVRLERSLVPVHVLTRQVVSVVVLIASAQHALLLIPFELELRAKTLDILGDAVEVKGCLLFGGGVRGEELFAHVLQELIVSLVVLARVHLSSVPASVVVILDARLSPADQLPLLVDILIEKHPLLVLLNQLLVVLLAHRTSFAGIPCVKSQREVFIRILREQILRQKLRLSARTTLSEVLEQSLVVQLLLLKN
jgi:hypothetical protein